MTTSQTRLSKILSRLDNTPLICLSSASKETGCNIYWKGEFLNQGDVTDNEIINSDKEDENEDEHRSDNSDSGSDMDITQSTPDQIHPIPRIIWTFWNGNPSPIVRLCIDTWKRTNPEWKIILLNENNVNEYILKSDLPKYWDYYSGQYARLTDFMRLYLLCKYGGAWLDASIILNKKLTDIFPLNNKKYEFWGGYADHNMSPSKSFIVTPESWLLISRPGNKFICLWYDEFYYYLNNYSTTNKYITYLKHQKHVNWSGLNNISMQYHTVWFSLRKTLYDHKIDGLDKSIYLTDFIKDKGINLHHKANRGWSPETMVKYFTQDNNIKIPDIIKMSYLDRKKINNILINNKYSNNSILARIIR
eukprot:550605_1